MAQSNCFAPFNYPILTINARQKSLAFLNLATFNFMCPYEGFSNKKMCFSGDAGKWLGLKDIEAFYLPAKNSTTKLISENFLATSIAVSHISKGIRFITYGYNLTQNGDMDIHYNIVDV